MDVMFVLIGFSLLVALVFLGAFLWAVRSGQYEDQYTPSVRMLFEEKRPAESIESTKEDAIQTEYRSKE
ncbi:MAG: cbb3-type cytochrome oxidase assembly protein CcoS [Ignavibacteria bacterium]|nr:cbb3-type cytochrome oxidase assembly protein CcoS [Ignavibacteria bacterium]